MSGGRTSFVSIRSSRSPTCLTLAELFGGEPDVKLALDPHHQSDQVDRIEPKGFAKVLIVLRQRHTFHPSLLREGPRAWREAIPCLASGTTLGECFFGKAASS